MKERLLTFLMKLYPREFREARAEEILGFIEEDRTRSRRGAVRFWMRTLFDLFASAARLRWRERRLPRSARRRISRSPFDDLRQALRSVRATPLASAVIVLTLAIGIGLDTAIFSVVDSVLLDPFPYEEPDRLFYLHARWTEDGVERARHSGRDLERFSRETRAFEDLAAVMSIRQNLTDIDVPHQVQVGWSSRNPFRLLGVSPILGSGFTEDSPPGTLVLSHGLWRDAFGAPDDVVGRVVRLDGHPYTVAGVLPRSFALYLPRFPAHVDVWKVPDDWWQNGDPWSGDGSNVAMFDILGRLDPAASPVQAREEMRTLAAARRAEDAESSRAGLEYDALPLQDTGGARLWSRPESSSGSSALLP